MAVIINTCNRPFMLKNLVHSVADQLKARDWIIIVNDGDPDKELPEMEKGNIYEVRHCKDYYAVASGRNKGAQKALNLGYKWGVFIDDDVEVSSGWLKNHRKAVKSKKTIYAGKVSLPINKQVDYRLTEKDNDMTIKRLIQTGGCNFSTYLPFFLEDGGYDEYFDGGYGYEDVELLYRFSIEKDWEIEYLPDAIMTNLRAPTSSKYDRGGNSNRDKAKEKIPEEYIWGNF